MISQRSHAIYITTIVLKGAFAVGECVSGLVLYFATQDSIRALNRWILQTSIFSETRDVHLNFFKHALENMQLDAKTFVSIYLLVHGLLKIGIVLGLLSGRRWAFPVGLIGLGLFVIYQVYHYFKHGHPIILYLAALDVLIMVLVWREWKDALATPPTSANELEEAASTDA